MSGHVEKLFDEALLLSDEDRASLLALLEDHFRSDPPEEVQTAWDSEIAQRIQEIDNGTAQMISWDETRRMILEDFNESPKC